ncbi:hypothetical protein [Psychrobacter sp. DM8]|uniref:hypothetical protein n=1 Tax=unclassified Psychrobacter TaxID=196806 RepID=UPI003F4F720E
MNNELKGSDLTRAMLAWGYEQIWCAVDDDNDEQAMRDHCGNDFTACIVSCDGQYFYCDQGTPWACAVPIKIIAVKQEEVDMYTQCIS